MTIQSMAVRATAKPPSRDGGEAFRRTQTGGYHTAVRPAPPRGKELYSTSRALSIGSCYFINLVFIAIYSTGGKTERPQPMPREGSVRRGPGGRTRRAEDKGQCL